METLDLIATSTFGLESIVARELQELGYTDQKVETGKVYFKGDLTAICRTNLWLRSADRVLVNLGQFEAKDFGVLFDRVSAIDWSEWLPIDARFPVSGKTLKSQLHSVRTCQGVTKKAIVESLKRKYQRFQFEESGTLFPIEVSILKDQVTLSLDTTGPGLHKRGYRDRTYGAAPLKETLAAALVQLSFWDASRPLIDPFCGTGTIPIEAAMIGRRMAPGLKRSFEAEGWTKIPRKLWVDARTEAKDLKLPSSSLPIIGTDIDKRILREARKSAREAGVEADLHLQEKDVRELTSKREYGCIITNPPYGERIGKLEDMETLYRELAVSFAGLETWSAYVLSGFHGLERVFERDADRRRKLYNGRIECCLYQYYGPRPPRPEDASPPESTSDDASGTGDREQANVGVEDAGSDSPSEKITEAPAPASGSEESNEQS